MNSEDIATNASDPWRRMALLVAAAPPLPELAQPTFQCLVWRRWLLHNFSIFFLQYAGLFLTTLNSLESPLWFASGTALGFLFLRGTTVLPGIGLGTLLAYAVAGLDIKRAAACALVFMLQAFFLLKLSYRAGLLSLVFFRRSDFLKFLAICMLATGCGSGLLTLLCFSSLSQTAPIRQLFGSSWLANWNGCVLLACALFTWDAAVPDFPKWKALPQMKLGLLAIAWLLLCVGLVASQKAEAFIFFAGFLSLSLLWVAKVYRWYGTLAVLFLGSLVLSLAGYFNGRLLAQQQAPWVFYRAIFWSLLITAGLLAAVPEEQESRY